MVLCVLCTCSWNCLLVQWLLLGISKLKGKINNDFVYVLWEIHVSHSNQLYHMYSTCNGTFNIENILFHFWGKEGEGGKIEGEDVHVSYIILIKISKMQL